MNAIWLFLFLETTITSTLKCINFYLFDFFFHEAYIIRPFGKKYSVYLERKDTLSERR